MGETEIEETPAVFQCDICKKHFPRKRNLRVHIMTHNEKTIPCTMCEKMFKSKTLLTEHMKIHLAIKNYECEVCEKKFTTSTHLTSHRRTHTNERPYQCDICEKAFTVSNALTIHRRIHTGERPYKCDQCDKAFRESSKLTNHKRTHTKEKPYSCDICGVKFSQLGNVKTHMDRVHSADDSNKKYECEKCNKKFFDHKALITHMNYHLGIKDFACSICPKKFVTKTELKTHLNYHNGVKNYQCDICEKKFSQHPHWKWHMKMHKSSKVQCNKCLRFFIEKNFKKHKCLPVSRNVSESTMKKVKDKIERSPLKRNKVSTKTNSKEEMMPDNNDKMEAPKLLIKFKMNTKNQSNKSDESTVETNGEDTEKDDNDLMVSLHTSVDIKEEASEDEEELFAMFEEDSKPKPQINTSVSDDEISIDDPDEIDGL